MQGYNDYNFDSLSITYVDEMCVAHLKTII